MSLNEALTLVEEIVSLQQARVKQVAREIIPHLTDEDILQPNDYPVLENHPIFRYEEGVLEGAKTVETALRGLARQEKR